MKKKKLTDDEIDKWANEYSLRLIRKISDEIFKPEDFIDASKIKIFINGLKVGAKWANKNTYKK